MDVNGKVNFETSRYENSVLCDNSSLELLPSWLIYLVKTHVYRFQGALMCEDLRCT